VVGFTAAHEEFREEEEHHKEQRGEKSKSKKT